MLVTVDGDDLVGVDLATLKKVVLAERAALAASVGVPGGGFGDVDLSPDGATVVFAFGGFDGDQGSHGLFEVPSDGSAEPILLTGDSGRAWFSEPKYSPDGRLLSVWDGSHFVVLNEARTSAGPGVRMLYAPDSVVWSPAGDRLVWLDRPERSACCTWGSVDVDPATGRIVSERTFAYAPGEPYFDPSGELRFLEDQGLGTFDVDATGRFAVFMIGDGSQQFAWLDLTTEDREPRRFGLDVDMRDAAAIAW